MESPAARDWCLAGLLRLARENAQTLCAAATGATKEISHAQIFLTLTTPGRARRRDESPPIIAPRGQSGELVHVRRRSAPTRRTTSRNVFPLTRPVAGLVRG